MKEISNKALYAAIEAVANSVGPTTKARMHMAIAAVQMDERKAVDDQAGRDMAVAKAVMWQTIDLVQEAYRSNRGNIFTSDDWLKSIIAKVEP